MYPVMESNQGYGYMDTLIAIVDRLNIACAWMPSEFHQKNHSGHPAAPRDAKNCAEIEGSVASSAPHGEAAHDRRPERNGRTWGVEDLADQGLPHLCSHLSWSGYLFPFAGVSPLHSPYAEWPI